MKRIEFEKNSFALFYRDILSTIEFFEFIKYNFHIFFYV